jgi:thymidylate synthase
MALDNVLYVTEPPQHFDENPIRMVNPDYVFREFLWFLTGDATDTRMTKYAQIWKTCIDDIGRINSNYGQYLFERDSGFNGAFFRGLDVLGKDNDSRRCWISIFQERHQTDDEHTDYPCTTGIGFSIKSSKLCMNVHMRSQDLWWGAANDQPICYLFQLLAQAYLRHVHDVWPQIGPITHYIDNLHFYDRHWDQAMAAMQTLLPPRAEMEEINELCQDGFSLYDIVSMFKITEYWRDDIDGLREYSPLMKRVLAIPGDYGFFDKLRSW